MILTSLSPCAIYSTNLHALPMTSFTPKHKRAIIYTRVSTEEQAEKGTSLRSQEDGLRKYCSSNGIEVVHHFSDDASGKSFDRPQFVQLLSVVRSNPGIVDVLLVVRWDRFSRNTYESFGMVATLSGLGVDVVAITQELDQTVPESVILQALYFAVPEAENRRRALNTKQGMRRARREGRWCGTAPIGYEWRGRGLVPGEKAEVVREAFRMMSTGLFPQSEVLKELRSKGLTLSRTAFGRMLRNPVYRGRIRIEADGGEPEMVVPGLHAPIVEAAVFERTQRVLQALKSRRKSKSRPTPLSYLFAANSVVRNAGER